MVSDPAIMAGHRALAAGTRRLTNATSVAAGSSHTCAVRSDDSVACWGANGSGQLGNGSNTESSVPVTVVGLTDVTGVTAGEAHTCAARSDNSVACWGGNGKGQLGDGTTDSASPVIVQKPQAIGAVVQTAGGNGYTCALFANGTVACWGDNSYGQLGDGTNNIVSYTPVTVTGLTNATSITAGLGHACVARSDGTVACWGYNGWGQLGDGTNTNSNTPVTVTGQKVVVE